MWGNKLDTEMIIMLKKWMNRGSRVDVGGGWGIVSVLLLSVWFTQIITLVVLRSLSL